MKEFILLLCLLLLPSQARADGFFFDSSTPSAPIAFGSGTALSNTGYGGTSINLTKTVTAGDLVIVYVAGSDTLGTISVSDDASVPNTYISLTKRGSAPCVQMFWSKIATSKTNAIIAVSVTTNGAYMYASAFNFTGIAASPLDKDGGSSNWSDTISASTGVLAQTNEVIIAGVNTAGTISSEDGNFTRAGVATGTRFPAYRIVSSTNSLTYSTTLSAASDWALSLVSFKGL